jgi:RNA polymerase sigma-70 factor, ECF subfamily
MKHMEDIPRTALLQTEMEQITGDLFVAERRRLTSLALRITRNTCDAEDVVQSAFVRALEHAEQLRSATSRAAWLYTTVRRLATDTIRALSRIPRVAVELNSLPAVEHERFQWWREIHAEHLWQSLKECELSAAVREAFELRQLHRLSYKQIAARQRVDVSTVGTRIHRAKRQLRHALLEAPPHRSARS